MKRIFFTAAILFACSCDTDTSHETTNAKPKASATTPGARPTNAQRTNDSETPDQNETHPSKQADPQPTGGSKLAIAPMLPRPIESEQDAQECLAAAAELDRSIKEMTGVGNTSVTKRLKDCVVQYDADKGGYNKFYPGRTHVRLNLRSSDVADLNVLVPGCETAVIHIRIDDTSMWVDCRNLTGTQELNAYLFRSSDTEPFRRSGDWAKIADPDTLENYCMQVYNDFQQLRGN